MSRALISVDTNVLVRFLVNDDPEQARRAKMLIAEAPVLVTPTVLLETEWVLRAGYRMRAVDIVHCFRALLGLPTVTIRDPQAIAEALDACEAGLDFADASHLALSIDATGFATFDTRFARDARPRSGLNLMAP